MNLENFVSKYNWQKVDFDWVYAYQCVDLIKLYISEFLWKNYGAIWHAKDYFANLPKKDFEKIKFSWNLNDFLAWDVVIWWATKINPYWHIWIILNIWKNFIEVLEQNGASGSWNGKNWNEIRIKKFEKFDWIVGVCRFKKNTPSPFLLDEKGNKKEISEGQKILDEPQELWIWNGKEWDKPAIRRDVVYMVHNSHTTLLKEILELKKILGK